MEVKVRNSQVVGGASLVVAANVVEFAAVSFVKSIVPIVGGAATAVIATDFETIGVDAATGRNGDDDDTIGDGGLIATPGVSGGCEAVVVVGGGGGALGNAGVS